MTQPLLKPEEYWHQAGEQSYAEAMYKSREVERHVNLRMWNEAVAIGKQLGLTAQSRILDLGCGDGAFANQVLSQHFASVDGFDLSEGGIKRANAEAAKPSMKFTACDVTAMDYAAHGRYDGAFLIGILHHVKKATPNIIRDLRKATDKVIVLEPNGNHIVRKLLELTPTYKAAGEDSFRTAQLQRMFEKEGWKTRIWKRVNLFPNFTPAPLFRLLKPFEPIIEQTPGLRALCTVNLYGFTAN